MCEHTAHTKLQPRSSIGALQYGGKLMCVKRANLISHIKIYGWVFLGYHIDGTTQGRTAKLIWHDALVNLYTFNHACGNIVQSNEVSYLRQWRFVNEKSHALTFQPSYRYARRATHSARVSYCHAYSTCQHIVDVGCCSL